MATPRPDISAREVGRVVYQRVPRLPRSPEYPPLLIRGSLGRIAVGAVHRPVAGGLEGHLGVLAALGAHGRENLPLAPLVAATRRSPAAPARLVGGPAIGAPARLVGEALLCEELLLPLREDELAV